MEVPVTLSTKRSKTAGFTLAELLIALAILGVIATFTIPKVLNSSTSSQNTAIAKEAASMISGAFSAYQLNNTVADGTTPGVLTQFMNYVKVDSTSATFAAPAAGTGATLSACNTANIVCLQLHNGGYIQYATDNKFNGTLNTAAILVDVDPDGKSAGAGAVTFVQMRNGRFTTRGNESVYNTTAGAVVIQTTDPAYIQNWN